MIDYFIIRPKECDNIFFLNFSFCLCFVCGGNVVLTTIRPRRKDSAERDGSTAKEFSGTIKIISSALRVHCEWNRHQWQILFFFGRGETKRMQASVPYRELYLSIKLENCFSSLNARKVRSNCALICPPLAHYCESDNSTQFRAKPAGVRCSVLIFAQINKKAIMKLILRLIDWVSLLVFVYLVHAIQMVMRTRMLFDQNKKNSYSIFHSPKSHISDKTIFNGLSDLQQRAYNNSWNLFVHFTMLRESSATNDLCLCVLSEQKSIFNVILSAHPKLSTFQCQ